MRDARVGLCLAALPLTAVIALPFAAANPTPTALRRAVTAPVVVPAARAVARPAARPTPPRDLGRGQLIEGSCGPTGLRRCIAFTFDDGPECHNTPRLLDMLDQRGVKATFFVVGHRLDGNDAYHAANRAVLRDVLRRGHLVGNHTYHHVELDRLRPERLAAEIDQTATLIQGATGRRPWLFRAPFGALTRQRTVDAVFARGYTPVYWELDTRDWETPSVAGVVENFRQALRESPRGGVVLLHDTHWWSVAAFPQIMAVIERRNASLIAAGEAPYQLVNLDAFYRPLGAEAPRGMPLPRRRSHDAVSPARPAPAATRAAR
jgi:peptidoglycan/xylan/chitin deacetylase (PgdA/CDA1 family)